VSALAEAVKQYVQLQVTWELLYVQPLYELCRKCKKALQCIYVSELNVKPALKPVAQQDHWVHFVPK
jgi:hypothetical protein